MEKGQNLNRLIWGNLGQQLINKNEDLTLALLQDNPSKEMFSINYTERRRIKKKIAGATTSEQKIKALNELKKALREENYYREVAELIKDKSEIVEGSLIMGDIPIQFAELLEND